MRIVRILFICSMNQGLDPVLPCSFALYCRVQPYAALFCLVLPFPALFCPVLPKTLWLLASIALDMDFGKKLEIWPSK